jgi:integral membrane protein (TIGR01906 family)
MLSGFITLGFPVLLLLLAARLVMTPLFLHLVYTRPGFSEDFYGFTMQDRLDYAPYALNYLLNGEDITYLSRLRFPDNTTMYNARELRHMRDVKIVTQTAFAVAAVGSVVFIAAALTLWRFHRPALRAALYSGALLTLLMIAAVILVAILNWDFFFTSFHTLLFESGSWRFAYSDTLIRLFPEQFWFEAALTIGGIAASTAVLTLLVVRRWQPQK